MHRRLNRDAPLITWILSAQGRAWGTAYEIEEYSQLARYMLVAKDGLVKL